LDVEGRLIDFKTASRRPSCVSPDYAFQLATYRQITPGASGEVRIDSLVKTQTVQIVQQAYTVSKPDIRATRVLYPMARRPWEPGCIVRIGSPCCAARSTAASGSTANRSSPVGSGRPDPRPHAVNK